MIESQILNITHDHRSVLWPDMQETETSSMSIARLDSSLFRYARDIDTDLLQFISDFEQSDPAWFADAQEDLKKFCDPKHMEISEQVLRAVAKATNVKPKISRSPESGLAISFIQNDCAISIVAEFDIALIVENYPRYKVEMIFDTSENDPGNLLWECRARLTAFFSNNSK